MASTSRRACILGKQPRRLDLAESALLAAVAQAPALNPMDAPQAALERQRDLIELMLEQGLINSGQADQALQKKLTFAPTPAQPENPAPAFTALVIRQLQASIGRDRLERGGFQVITTLDYRLQLQSACAAATQLSRLQSPPPADPLAADGSECQAARLLPTLPTGAAAPDSLSSLGANVVVLDPQKGEILAMVGQPEAGLDPSETPGHSPGSILTPFIYLSAFTRGMGPATLVWDIPKSSSASALQNYDGKFHGPVRLRLALANDYLVPAVKAFAQVGTENVWRSARQLGLTSLQPPATGGASGLPFSGGEITLLEASQAFGVFANQGKLVGRALETVQPGGGLSALPAAAIQKVQDDTGRVWLEWGSNASRPVVNPQLAYLMTNILSDEAARWPSLGHPNALEIGRPAAAKLGRTPTGLGAWTIGYTPQMVVGVWVGQKDEAIAGRDLPGQSANNPLTPNQAAALWHAIMQFASQSLPPLGWAQPPGISSRDVCDPSGLLPTPDCPSVVNEVFLQGNEPTQDDNLFRKVEVNRASGNLATIFTPSDLVEERVYMIVPPEAVEWAQTAGLATPPETYDVIAAPDQTSPDVQIDSPGMFAYVRGKVKIAGKAAGQDFNFYRLQVGQGLNPQEWLQIGQDVTRPVSSGELGTWDTSGLSGLYALQLLVVRQDKHVESAIAQVTVDNQAPVVQILYPEAGQELALLPSRTVTFQFNASDDLALAHVQVLVDDKLLTTLQQAPFAVPWKAQTGNHTLLVIASDLAGNQSQDKVIFSVK